MQKILDSYKKNDLIVFSSTIKHELKKSGEYKKNLLMPKDWANFTLENFTCNDKHNGIFLLTGKVNNIIVIDIDNVNHWQKLLEEQNEKEPKTVNAISGNGGIHLYFKYDEEISNVKSTSHIFGKDYDIDIRTNGGCIIVPPSKYYNEKQKKEVKYEWERSILEKEPKEMPSWMKKLITKQR
jgi:hypothetical protein